MLFLCPIGGDFTRKLKNYKPTKFKAKDSYYDKEYAEFAVAFIESLCHTKVTWAGKRFERMDWQEQIIRDLFGILKPNGYRQFNTAYIEIQKMNGKSELAAAVNYTDNMDTLQRTFRGLKNSIMGDILPGFNDILLGLTGLMTGADGAKEQLQLGAQEIVTSISGLFPQLTGYVILSRRAPPKQVILQIQNTRRYSYETER